MGKRRKSSDPQTRVVGAGSVVILSDGSRVNGCDLVAMLKAQHKILMKLSKLRASDEAVQSVVADANILGLELQERVQDTEYLTSLLFYRNLP